MILSALFKNDTIQGCDSVWLHLRSGRFWLEEGGKRNHGYILGCFVRCTFENVALVEPYNERSLSESIALSSEGQRRRDEMSQPGGFAALGHSGYWGQSSCTHRDMTAARALCHC